MSKNKIFKTVLAISGQLFLGLIMAIQILRVISRQSVKDTLIALVLLILCIFGFRALNSWRKKI